MEEEARDWGADELQVEGDVGGESETTSDGLTNRSGFAGHQSLRPQAMRKSITITPNQISQTWFRLSPRNGERSALWNGACGTAPAPLTRLRPLHLTRRTRNVLWCTCHQLFWVGSGRRSAWWSDSGLAGISVGNCSSTLAASFWGAGLVSVGALGTALTHLDLRASCIDDGEVEKLAQVLGKCTALAYLDLSMNRICAEGVGRLAGVLGECKALAQLDLNENYDLSNNRM
eukprot:1199843-Rhodomonas_salina.1